MSVTDARIERIERVYFRLERLEWKDVGHVLSALIGGSYEDCYRHRRFNACEAHHKLMAKISQKGYYSRRGRLLINNLSEWEQIRINYALNYYSKIGACYSKKNIPLSPLIHMTYEGWRDYWLKACAVKGVYNFDVEHIYRLIMKRESIDFSDLAAQKIDANTEWCCCFDGENFDGEYESREKAIEALEEANEFECKQFGFVGTIERPNMSFCSNEEAIIESIIDGLADEVGERADDFEVDIEDERDLARRITETVKLWIKERNIKPNAYMVVNIEQVELKSYK